MKSIVIYFSAEAGKTRKIAKSLAEQAKSSLFEIVPEKPYTEADLRWTNPLARCNREKIGKKDVLIAGRVEEWKSGKATIPSISAFQSGILALRM